MCAELRATKREVGCSWAKENSVVAQAGSRSVKKSQRSRVEKAQVKAGPNAAVLAAVIVAAGCRPRWIDLAATGRAVQVEAIAIESPGQAMGQGGVPAGCSSREIAG